MKPLPPLSPEVQALFEAYRAVLPLPRSQQNRVLARAAATPPDPPRGRVAQPRSWVLAAAAGAVFALGAAAYAGHGWLTSRAPSAQAPHGPAAASQPEHSRAPVMTVRVHERGVAPTVTAPREGRSRSWLANSAPTGAELTLLLRANQAMNRDDFAGALAAVAEHARRFRNGRLVEEREALRVQSLAGLGLQEEARRAAAQFHARFPRSVLLSTVTRIAEP